MRAIFLADGKVFTTGFSRMSERQLALWDPVSDVASLRQAGLRPGPHPRSLLLGQADRDQHGGEACTA